MRTGISKRTGIEAALRAIGELPSVTVAVGDGENDISLIEAAGMGVAMGNAIPALAQRARMLTASNDADGVALALERFIAEGELTR